MIAQLRPAITLYVLLTVLTGLLYPGLVTGLSKVVFPAAAEGSLVYREDVPVGSALIGQPFDDPGYFWGRLSATSPPYNGGASSGSNLGPLHPALTDAARARVEALGQEQVPVDLATSSGSGLDPHISPASALLQVPRVAEARGLPEARMRALVAARTEGRWLGVFGEPRVNVLLLNLDLDEASSAIAR